MGDEQSLSGHRKRLRQRFLKDLGNTMEDYELLELLLTQAIPRSDVKPLSKRLLQEFGGFSAVLSASTAELERVSGVGEAVVVAIKIAQQSAFRLLKRDAFNGHILSNWQKLMDYIQTVMCREKVEQLRILFLNQKNHLIADEVQHVGTVNHTPLYTREVIRRALDLGAISLIIIHNHPSGDPTPSGDDIAATRELKTACQSLGMILHDHIVVGQTTYISFKNQGLL